MSSSNSMNSSTIQQNLSLLSLGTLCKSLAISGIVLFLFYTLLFKAPHYQPSDLLSTIKQKWPTSSPISINPAPTNISHIVFSIAGSMNTWKYKKPYNEAWWRPNMTRGYLFLDRAPTQEFQPWPSTSPPFRVNEDLNILRIYPRLVPSVQVQVRMLRRIMETFKLGDKDVRWYVMADDDTVLFVDNLVEVLAKYNHSKFYYIGSSSEFIPSNGGLSFEMAFGGAGFALSYPLVEVLATQLDDCIERYVHVDFSDFMLHLCLADLGVSLTHEKGFHQIDLRSDISGFLSAHPPSPFLSLHHIDTIDPIFPSMNRFESINHLMKAAKVDQSRLLQQTICHYRPSNWSFSISWGYSVNVYENIFPQSLLRRPLETFRPWWGNARPSVYMFNTRWTSNDSCEAPHVFFLDSVEHYTQGDQIVTTYFRASPRGLPGCSLTGNHSADAITKIQVFSPARMRMEARGRDCCDIVSTANTSVAEVKYRTCMKDEVIA
ncbi:hypothetical protein CJ030_MR3G005572 [Morella rubra]|uniref:Beta-1,3-glucosyltransferase n=1 Tax=Morella rubra TaxID=262757 RepID=A0A6A1W4M7_9ROSI|nr:hypothetical protein CJ030_MR3G005572 [Morella rubra]